MEYQEGSYEVEGDGYGLPDAPHMEIMFDALEATGEQQIDGNEGFSLTQAQIYAQGVLHSAGIFTQAQVTGNEGVFSAIGDGFKAVWDYIVKTFKAIWDFFFGRDNEKEAEEAKDAVAGDVADLTKADNGTQTEAEANAQLSALGTAAGGEDGNEAMAKTIAEAKKGDLKAKRAAIKAALKEMPKMNKKAKQKLEQSVANAVKAKRAFMVAATVPGKGSQKESNATTHLATSGSEAFDVMADLANEVAKTVVKEANYFGQLEKATSIDSVQGAIAFGKATETNIDLLKALGNTFKAKKGKIDSLIKSTEAKMKKAKDGGDKAELKKELDSLRVCMNLAVRISKLMEINYHRLQVAFADLTKVFGL